MKKLFYIFLGLIGLIVIAIVAVPIIYKDDIQGALDEQLANNVNATIYYDTDDFSLSLIKSFPNLSVAVGGFGVIGIDEFEGDTLTSIGSFQLVIDVMSVISGEQIVIKNVLLDQPRINVKVLPGGKANYDIAVESSTPVEEDVVADTTAPAALSLAVNKWEIRDGYLSYNDMGSNMSAVLGGLNHVGQGDFSLDIFDLSTETNIEDVSFSYEGERYLSKKTFSAALTLNMNLSEMTFTFKENKVALNDFGFGFDGFVKMPGEDIEMDITFEGKEINLKSILSLIPGAYQEYLDGVTASGEIGFEGYVKGVYNETSMPMVAANLSVNNGSMTYAEYPIPIEELNIAAGFDYPSANLKDFSFTVENFSVLVDGEQSKASLLFKDLEDYFWDFKFDGNLDLEKLTKIIPLEGMDLKGKINAKLASQGRMSDVEAERYANLPTSGSMSITDLVYSSPDLPQGFGIAETQASFSPASIQLASFRGNAGRTDLNLTGEIRNYLEFGLGEDATLEGSFDFKSTKVDVNEWMVPEDSLVEEEVEDTTALEVVRIPTNIDFVLASSIDQLVYDNLSIDNFAGQVVIRNGALMMENVNFQLLEGTFVMSGGYETLPEEPLYDFDLKIEKLSIPKAYQSFASIKQLAPFAEKMTGDFSTQFQIGGSLLQDMSPNYNNMQGLGIINVLNGALNDVQVLSKVSGFAGGNTLKDNDGTVSLKDVLLQTEIKEGRVYVKPFDMQIGGYTTSIEGSNGIVGDLDYAMTVKEVSTGPAGEALNSLVSSFAGTNSAISSKVDINLGVAGTFDDPKVKLLGIKPSSGGNSNSAKNAAAARAKEELAKAKARAKAEAAKRRAEAERLAAEKKAQAKKELESQKTAVKLKVNKATSDTKKAAEKELNSVKDKVKLPFGKKKKN